VSIVLHDKRCWLEQFEPARFRDPQVDAFARGKVKVEIDPALEGTAAVVEIRTTDGASWSDRRTAARGDPADPLTRAEIQEKLRTAAAGLIGAAEVERIIALVDGLERVDDVRNLLAAVRAPVGR
jgi:2-methylcitrate dehydratase PrpD